jgi:hypothetical protein
MEQVMERPTRPYLGGPDAQRWECDCRPEHPVLLGMVDGQTVTIKSRERVWFVRGEVVTTCPRCRASHVSSEVGR